MARKITMESGNRGNFGAQMVVIDTRAGTHRIVGGLGRVQDVLATLPHDLSGDIVIAQTRYPTQDPTAAVQPYHYPRSPKRRGRFLAHNGNVEFNPAEWERARTLGQVPRNRVDTELIGQLACAMLDRNGDDTEDALRGLHATATASMNLILSDDEYGRGETWSYRNDAIHPLCSWHDAERGIYAVASESAALVRALMNPGNLRDIPPGFAVRTNMDGPQLYRIATNPSRQGCAMERIYFAHDDTVIDDRVVVDSRREFGRRLAEEDRPLLGHEIPEDAIVCFIPQTPDDAAEQYALTLGLEFVPDAVRKRPLADRTFIEGANDRLAKAKSKFIYRPDLIKGRTVILIDDSIVRLTTLTAVLPELDAAEPEAIHVRSYAPPLIGPCPYGLAVATRDELFTAQFPELRRRVYDNLPASVLEDMAAELRRVSERERGHGAAPSRVRSIRYLPLRHLAAGMGKHPDEVCDGCMSNVYADERGQNWADTVTGRKALPMA